MSKIRAATNSPMFPAVAGRPISDAIARSASFYNQTCEVAQRVVHSGCRLVPPGSVTQIAVPLLT